MRRGSTPTFTILLPIDSKSVSDISATLVQGGREIISIDHTSITLDGKTASFRLSDEQTMLFDSNGEAEFQMRIRDTLNNILISDIKRIAIMKKYPENA